MPAAGDAVNPGAAIPLYNLFDDFKKVSLERSCEAALIHDGIEVTYQDLRESAAEAASAFREVGICDYAKCVLIGGDTPGYVAASLGLLSSGGVFVSAGKEISKFQLDDLMDRISVGFAVVEQCLASHLEPSCCENRGEIEALGTCFRIFCRSAPLDTNKPEPEFTKRFKKINPAFIRFTSGTTGESKGVVLSHQTIKDRIDLANNVLCIGSSDRILWLLPMAYHFAVSIMLYLTNGATIDISSESPADVVLRKLTNGQTTFVYATPYHYSRLLRESERIDLKSGIPECVRFLISTAQALSPDLASGFARRFGRHINQAYGIIECGLPCINTCPDESNVLTVGQPVPGCQIRLALREHEDTSGEIVVKAPGVFDAYYQPWLKRSQMLCGGCFFTGDIGQFDEKGNIRIVGRKKSVINFLGLKVFPEQVEEVLLRCPEVSEARVFGENHNECGQLVMAEVVTTPGNRLDVNKAIKFCSHFLSSHEVPTEIRVVKEIPKTCGGKVLRRDDCAPATVSGI
ncbi:MAG: acyl--CoA ligase [Victivallales bacterium]|nr:acyl--CoA ligase [Victivallales bacterium]